MMDRYERVQTALAGKAVDRVPVSAWGHFYNKETSAEGLADIMLSFQSQYDWDFLKIHARASYHVEGWGFTYIPSVHPDKPHQTTSHPIRDAKDWRKLRPLSPEVGSLKEQLRAIELIRKGLKEKIPTIMTVFSPLDVAEKLVDRDTNLLQTHLREDPESVNAGLAAISETFEGFMGKLLGAGIDGIYFSTKWANSKKMTAKEYRDLALPHDLRVLKAARGFWMNFLHLCEGHVYLKEMSDYPVQVFHWDRHQPGNPNFSDGKRMVSAAVSGGVDSKTLAEGTEVEVEKKVRQVIEETQGRHFLLGPGCSIVTYKTPEANLRAMRKAVEKYGG
jgi:uroporphyrinogen decarboxylase